MAFGGPLQNAEGIAGGVRRFQLTSFLAAMSAAKPLRGTRSRTHPSVVVFAPGGSGLPYARCRFGADAGPSARNIAPAISHVIGVIYRNLDLT
ncbi:hypothetical protein MesoLj113c_61800 [Mesorhizobium sp. 113-3-9]|nr:hypothetical protein MesoLj113c_61800 [Mesorhizobium sp. 113-3-9]